MNPLYRNDRPGVFPDSWYVASTDIPAQRAPLQGEQRCDVAIIGAGYTGLTAALELAQKGMSVIVLEAHRAGFGASGRNGGQVGSGFNKDQQWLAARLGAGNARLLWDMAEEGKNLLRTNVAAHAPDARYTPGVLHGDWSAKGVAEEHRYAEWLAEEYGYDHLTPLDRAAFQQICNAPVYAGGTLDMGAGHIHPLRYALGLARAAEGAGAQIFEGAEVVDITNLDAATGPMIHTPNSTVQSGHLLICGNGYLPGLSRRYGARVMPINSFIAATEPLGDRAADVLRRDIAVADSKFVVNYFRLSEDQRLLFGGRESYSIGFPRDILTALRARMEVLFPQLRGVGITHHWGGTLGITMSRLPLLTRLGPTTLAAGGFSGHGVALSGLAGRVMAEAVMGQAGRADVLGTLPTPPFPGGAMSRAPLLTLAMTWFSLRDRLGI